MLVLDTDKITGNEAIPYITGGNQGIDEIKNIYYKTICQFLVFLVNQDKNIVLIKQKINQLKLELENLPSKMSNLEEATNYFVQILQNPSQFYTSLNYHKKRRFQSILFPEGLNYSIKNKECRTKKVNDLFVLTNSFTVKSKNNPNKKPIGFSDGSPLVAGTGLEPVTFGL